MKALAPDERSYAPKGSGVVRAEQRVLLPALLPLATFVIRHQELSLPFAKLLLLFNAPQTSLKWSLFSLSEPWWSKNSVLLDFVTALVRVPDVKVVAKRRDKCPVNCKVESCFHTSS